MRAKKSTEKTKSAAVGEVLAKPALSIASMSVKLQRPPATIASASKDGHSMNAIAGSILLLVSEMMVAAIAASPRIPTSISCMQAFLRLIY
jgi:hypothetical protein